MKKLHHYLPLRKSIFFNTISVIITDLFSSKRLVSEKFYFFRLDLIITTLFLLKDYNLVLII